MRGSSLQQSLWYTTIGANVEHSGLQFLPCPRKSGAYVSSKHTGLPKGPKVVPFGGSYLEFYTVIPKRNCFGAYGEAQ